MKEQYYRKPYAGVGSTVKSGADVVHKHRTYTQKFLAQVTSNLQIRR